MPWRPTGSCSVSKGEGGKKCLLLEWKRRVAFVKKKKKKKRIFCLMITVYFQKSLNSFDYLQEPPWWLSGIGNSSVRGKCVACEFKVLASL